MPNVRRSWNRLAIACALSVAIHIAFGALAHAVPPAAAEPVEPPFRITSDPLRRIVPPTPRPTPRPRIAPVPPRVAPRVASHTMLVPHFTPHSSVAAPSHARIAVPSTHGLPHAPSNAHDGPAVTADLGEPGPGIPETDATAPPLTPATAEPTPACATSPVPAHTLVVAEPDADPQDQSAGEGSHADVRVDLSETGAVIRAEVVTSTGNVRLDEAARLAALHTTYAPEIDDCKPRAGSYLFRVDFTG